jgi:WD repeat-containing protein 61
MKLKIIKKGQLTGHSSAVYALSPGRNPNNFFSGSSDKFVTEWDLTTFTQNKFTVKLESPVYSVLFIESEKLLLIGNAEGGIHVVDVVSKKEVKLLKPHAAPVFDIKYSPLNKMFYTISADGSFSANSIEGLNTKKHVKLCWQKARSLDISPDEDTMAIACGDGSVRVFNLPNIKLIKSIIAHDLSANSVKFHPQKKYLLTGGRDAHLNVWDIKNDYTRIHSIPAHNFAIYSIDFNQTGSLFATASRDKSVKLWDAERFNVLAKIDRAGFNAHTGSVNKLLWNKSNGLLLTTGDDRAVMIWEVIT